MKKIKKLARKVMRIVKGSKVISSLIMTIMVFMAQIQPVFAAIDGNTIQNNLINNFVKPIYIVVFVGLLVKDFLRKNVASFILTFIIGGAVGIFVFYPNEVEAIIGTMKGIVGF